MVLSSPEMFTRTTPVLRRSSSLKGWNEIPSQTIIHNHRIPSPNPIIAPLKHVQSLPNMLTPISHSTKSLPTPLAHPVKSLPNMPTPPSHPIKSIAPSPHQVKSVHVHMPVQSPPSHPTHRTTPHPRPTLRPSRTSSPSKESSSIPPSITSPVSTPTRPPLLRRVITPTRPSILRRTAAHMDGTTFERVTRRRLLSPIPIHHTTSTSTIAPPPTPTTPTTPKRKHTPRRFTFAPIHVLTSQLHDSNMNEIEYEILQQQQEEQENSIPTPSHDAITWWEERESPIWQPPPALHTLIEDDWEDQHQHHHILPHTQTSIISSTSASTSTSTSTTSSRTPLRPAPILLPHTIGSAPPFRYNPMTPTTGPDISLHSPPICHDHDIATALLSPSFAQLSMDVDLMASLPEGWQVQEMGRVTPSPTTTTTTTPTTTSTWTPRVIDELSHEIGQWINMDTQ